MEKRDSIGYKDWFENLNEPAPEGVWNAIADQLDIDHAWDTISEELDLDEVWQNVEAGLPSTTNEVSSGQSNFGSAALRWTMAAILLLTLTTPIKDLNEGKAVDKASQVSGTNTVEKNDRMEANREEKPEVLKSTNDNEFRKSLQVPSPEPANETTLRADDPMQIVMDGNNEPGMQHVITKQNTGLKTDSAQENLLRDSTIVRAEFEKGTDSTNRITDRKVLWRIGLIASVKNTWLMNRETTNGLKQETLGRTRITFGKEFGIMLERRLNEKSSLLAEYFFYSEISQRYQEYIDALYQTKDVQLTYMKYQLSYRTKIFSVRSQPVYGLGGLHFSKLNNAHTVIGTSDELVTQQYASWDYGILGGLEIEIKLNPALTLVPGVRSSYGIKNIFTGTPNFPAEFNKTHTSSLGFSLTLKHGI